MTRDLDPRSARVAIGIPAVLALLSMIGPFSIDTPFPAFEQMGRDLRVETHELQLVVTVYMVPFAVMSIFHGPLSDALGRKPVIVGSVSCYVVASAACAFAPTLEWLLVGRAVQGLAAGGATIVSRTVIRDLFEGPYAQRLMSRVLIIFGIAPAVAPVVGGLLVQVGGWQLVFWFMAGLGLLLIAATLLVLPESHPVERRVPLRFGEVVRGLLEVGRVPEFHRVAWAATMVFGAQFLYIGGAAIFLVDLLGQGELDFWKLFVPMIGLMVLGSTLSARLARLLDPARAVSLGYGIAALGAVLGVLVALSPYDEALPWNIAGISLVAFGNGLAYPSTQLIVLDLVPHRRGAVMSAAAFVTLMFNAVGAVTITPLAGRSVLGFAVAALVMVLVGVLLWAWQLAVSRATRSCTSSIAETVADQG